MTKILLDTVPAVIGNFADGVLINLVEFATFVFIFLIAVFIAYIIYRSKKQK